MNSTHKTPAASTDRRPLRLRDVGIWKPLALALSRRGVTPNAISMAGLAAGLFSGALLAYTSSASARSCARCGCSRWRSSRARRRNILDGVMAVETGQCTPVGLLWNEVPDRVTDAATLIGASYALGDHPGWAAALAATLVGACVCNAAWPVRRWITADRWPSRCA
jgi:phosphatidylglycerophosphate synthase